MIDDNKRLIHRWFQEVWNEGREGAIDEMLAADAVATGLGDREADVHGPQEFKQFVRNMRGAMPDIRIDVEDVVAEADKAAVRVVLTGTHTGPGLGVPPTGNSIRVAGIVLILIRGGQIGHGWNSWDQLGLLRQIGALPATEGDDRFLTERK